MTTPATETTKPTRKYAKPRQLFLNQTTGEYCLLVKGPGGRSRYITTHEKDYQAALRRIEDTGVGKVIEIADDKRFTDQVVEVLTHSNTIPINRVYEEWLADAASRLAPKSLCHYCVIGNQFINTLVDPKVDVRIVTPTQINTFINGAPSLTRRQRRMSILESLFTFAFDQGYRKDNPGKRLGLKLHDLTFDQMERVIADAFTREEFAKLMAFAPMQGFWRWAIQLSWWLGFRISDICMLQWGSICASPGKLVVWQQKTRQRVELDLNDPVLGGGEVIRIIAEMRANITDAVHCFPEMRDVWTNTQGSIAYYFRECCLAAGLDGAKTFKCLRKSAAQRWEASGRDLKEIGKLLGHEGTGATPFYIETNGTKKPTVL